MAKFHNGTNGPAPCTASKRPCPVGGEHFESKEAAQAAYEKAQDSMPAGLSKKAARPQDQFTTQELPRNSRGEAELPAGKYYQVCSEDWKGRWGEEDELGSEGYDALFNHEGDDYPSGVPGDAPDTFAAYTLGGEPMVSSQEGWSGVTNSFVNEATYRKLVEQGNIDDYKPVTLTLKEPTSVGRLQAETDDEGAPTGLTLTLNGETKRLPFEGEINKS